MRVRILLGAGAVALAALTLTTPLAAQRVEVGVAFRDGPVGARVVYGDRDGWYHGRRWVVTRRPVRYDDDDYARVVYVEPVRAPRGYARGWWAHHGFVVATVWTDDDGRYYDRYDGRVGNLREVRVYERDGRYYQPQAGDWDD
ncbi:MAG TPA: hypothetical protein VFS28_04100 [Gemmatimonadales bacterium]|nr:hypothetical protein [Gemmatimonadales bacterium]